MNRVLIRTTTGYSLVAIDDTAFWGDGKVTAVGDYMKNYLIVPMTLKVLLKLVKFRNETVMNNIYNHLEVEYEARVWGSQRPRK